MRTNADFGKFLLGLKPQTRPTLLTFYNFIRNFSEHAAPFTPETVMQFYLKALSFEHWQKNILELSQETLQVLDQYLGTEMSAKAWGELRHANSIQILKIKHPKDQLEIIRQYILSKKAHVKFQIFADKNNVAHAVLIYPQGNVQVFTFDDMAVIRSGQIIPLLRDRKLEYTKQLELSPQSIQTVQISPFITAKFSLKDGMISGDLIRGFTLQNFRKIEIHELHQEPQLLYSIKRIERFFIDRSSEPLYTELIGVLEQTIDFLRKGLDGSTELAQKAYVRGQNALENIFIDDKMLSVLLKEIHDLLMNKGQKPWKPQNTFESTNFSHKLGYVLEDLQIDSSKPVL